MSNRLDDISGAVVSQNGKKVFVQKIAFTTAAAATAILTVDVEGNPIEVGAELCLQSDQDFLYQCLQPAATTSVTVFSGARPGVVVTADLQEFVYLGSKDAKLDVMGRTVAGNLVVFHVV